MGLGKGFTVLIGLVSSSAALADGAANDAAIALNPVIVTATRTAEKLNDTLAPVTLITRADIERLQPRDFQDLLVGLPGIVVSNSGGSGKATTISLRGTNSDHIIVLLDGIKLGSATLGTTSFEQIPVDLIDHIEIVRGPRSSLYGSEAIGGVIQIFTKRAAAGETLTPSFAIGAGSMGSARQELGLRGSLGQAWYSAGFSGQTTEGIDSRPSVGEGDDDGYWNLAGSLATGWRFANGAEISANWLRAKSRNEYDGSYTNESDNTQEAFGGQARFKPLSFWNVALSAGQSRDLSVNFHRPEIPANRSQINTARDSYSFQNDFAIGDTQSISAGVDQQHDRVSGSTAYDVKSRDNTGLFAQYQGGWRGHELSFSLRRDDNQQFGNYETGGAAYGYRFANGIRIGASHGTAFKAPTFNQLYFPNFGDPSLQPETSRSSEVNLSGVADLGEACFTGSVNGYRSRISNLIDFVPPTYAPENIGLALIYGVEAQAGLQWRGLRTQLTYNWLDPENRSDGANQGKTLQRRVKHNARVDLDYAFSRISVGSTVYAAGQRYSNPGNTSTTGGYTTVDLRAAYDVVPGWQLQLAARNLLDKRYQTVATYEQPGITFFATVRYTPTLKSSPKPSQP